MNKCHSPLNWQNDTTPAINDTNLNYMDGCIDTIDDRVVAMDTSKLESEDIAAVIKGVTMDDDSGVFTFTKWDNSTFTIDTKLEKIAVNFRYDTATQKLVITLDDGTTQEVDLSSLIQETDFADSSTIVWTVANHVATASIKANSITDAEMQTGYLTDCQSAKSSAETAATASNTNKLVAEGYAVGTQNGVEITDPTSPYYHNNAKYYSDHAGGQSLSALTDVQISSVEDGQALVYDATLQKWINGEASIQFALEPVTNLTATPGDAQIILAWTNPSDVVIGGTTVAELSSVRIYRDNVLIEDELISTYTDTGLENGHTYVYKVVAVTAKDVESAVATISATPLATGIAVTITNAGANASVTVTDGTDTYTATADASGNATIAVNTSGTYTITANGTGENKRYATEVVVSDEAVSVKMLNVPSEYKEALYIESHGTEYINTGFNPNQDTRLVIAASWNVGSGVCIAGARTAFRSNMFGINYNNGETYALYGTGSANFNNDVSLKHIYDFNKNQLYVDGTLKNTFSAETFAPNKPLAIFGMNENGTVNQLATGKIEYATIRDNNTLVRRYIPSILATSGEAGLYDTVNDVFYDNDGTGAFGFGFDPEDLEQKTITVEGAKEDNIVAKLGGTTVGTCIFASGQTSGTITVNVPKDGSSIPYVFESSVAKDTTTGTGNYTKNISLSNSSTSVKVMPETALYWYGWNESNWLNPTLQFADTAYKTDSVYPSSLSYERTKRANALYLYGNINTYGTLVLSFYSAISTTGYSHLKVLSSDNRASGVGLFASAPINIDPWSGSKGWLTDGITDYLLDSQNYGYVSFFVRMGTNDGVGKATMNAMWLE